jgi:putative FmdB family regulatory protein
LRSDTGGSLGGRRGKTGPAGHALSSLPTRTARFDARPVGLDPPSVYLALEHRECQIGEQGAPMPTYEYECRSCGHDLEVVQSFSDASLTTCPNCGGDLRKVYGNVGIVFRGSGFYKTDSRKTSSASTPSSAGDHSHHDHASHEHNGHDHSSSASSDSTTTTSTPAPASSGTGSGTS